MNRFRFASDRVFARACGEKNCGDDGAVLIYFRTLCGFIAGFFNAVVKTVSHAFCTTLFPALDFSFNEEDLK